MKGGKKRGVPSCGREVRGGGEGGVSSKDSLKHAVSFKKAWLRQESGRMRAEPLVSLGRKKRRFSILSH